MNPETDFFKFLDSPSALIIVVVAVLGFVCLLRYLQRPDQQ